MAPLPLPACKRRGCRKIVIGGGVAIAAPSFPFSYGSIARKTQSPSRREEPPRTTLTVHTQQKEIKSGPKVSPTFGSLPLPPNNVTPPWFRAKNTPNGNPPPFPTCSPYPKKF